MRNLWIIYNVFLRKTYKKWYKGRSSQVHSLALMFVIINFMSVIFLLEWFFPIKGFIYLSHTKVLPMAPTAMLVFGIIYGVLYLVFPPKKYSAEKIKIIRVAFEKNKTITRKIVITYIVISIIMYFVSMSLVFLKY